jgi:homoserine O-acetyltransferase
MDGAIPVAANPRAIRGRSLLWRRIIIEATVNDPGYQRGDYALPPHGYLATLPLFRMMLDSTANLDRALPDIASATAFVQSGQGPGHARVDANDAIYALDASRDYDPERELGNVRAKVLAIQFADDEILVPSLSPGEADLPAGVPVRRVIIPSSAATRGHSTLGLAEQWREPVAAFLRGLE